MALTSKGIIPPKEWVMNPSKLYYYSYYPSVETIAMTLAIKKLEIPQYCYHDPTIIDNNGKTVAMHIAA